ncbi:two-component system, NarL family, sensor histidine kinase DesK [Asanoa ishikariensis]|uniref:Two-component system, NarL family, sensor histidine kinase DesK n=1 Tax=Asanoa ishikariensis TaxID=137265 RepID=A0A1H3NZ66_9ACTN|nr:histidine kinase [Asanoa ishikariensis]SDY94003.1 two-component system, NarL family, sensor histidine kinase DesK [Asanoa ishikariensis]
MTAMSPTTGPAPAGPASVHDQGNGIRPTHLAGTHTFGPPVPKPSPFFQHGFGWLVGSVWLFYLGQPLGTILNHPGGFAKWFSLGALVAFGLSYVLVFLWTRRMHIEERQPRLRDGLVWLGVTLVLGLAMLPGAGGDWMVGLVYIAASAVMVLPPRAAVVAVAVVAAQPLLLPVLVPEWKHENGLFFSIVLAAFAMFGVTRMIDHNMRLTAANREIARLAVAEERARAARDLHDILGHSLTVITIKAELAGRLLPDAPDRAKTEVNDMERLAREALADIRRTVGAYREVCLEEELASARSALSAAGIEAQVPRSADVPEPRGTLFSWAVREGVTNVVRHSGATRCVITVRPDAVEIADNGSGPVAAAGAGGSGLRGLRERAEACGGQLSVGRAPGSGFVLRVSVPA